jgi:hypothetical protein
VFVREKPYKQAEGILSLLILTNYNFRTQIIEWAKSQIMSSEPGSLFYM